MIHDPTRVADLWRAHVGYVLEREFGRTAAEWGAANRVVFPTVWEDRHTWRPGPIECMEDEMLATLHAMCDHLGLTIPERSRGLDVMRRAEIHVCRHPDAVVPGTRDVIVELSRTWHVHMATGNPSWRVDALLEGLGLLDVVRTRCGPDLVDARKLTPDFFERVFRLAGALPTEGVVVDDNTRPLAIAAQLGARTVHVTSACTGPCGATLHIESILELPAALLPLV